MGIFTGPVDSFPPGELQPKWTRGGPSKGAIPNLFGTSNWFCRRQFFPWTRARGWFGDDSSTLHLLYTSFILLLHHHCPFVLTSFTGWSSERCPGIGFLSRGDREIGVLRTWKNPGGHVWNVVVSPASSQRHVLSRKS